MLNSYFSNCFVELSSGDFIASGSERDCYILSGDEEFCVKITHHRDRYKHQNFNDYKYYSRLSKSLVDWSRVAMCYGWVMTNKGEGLVFDLVKDFDGKPSLTLDKYIEKYGLNDEVEKELEELRGYLIFNNIIVCDLRDRNIACQVGRDGLLLKLIDGVGNRDYFKICDWWRLLGRKKIERHWRKFEKNIVR